MSRSPGLWIASAVLGMLLPVRAGAQSVEALEARVQQLERDLAQAKQEEDSLSAARRRSAIGRFITVEAGGFRLQSTPEIRTDATRAGELASGILRHTYQAGVDSFLSRIPFAIQPEPAADSLGTAVWFPPGSLTLFAPAGDRVQNLAVTLIAQAYQRLWLDQDPALNSWLGSPPAVTLDTTNDLSRAYLDLATSASPAARRCLVSAAECRDVLGLTRPPDPALRWDSPAGRRALARELSLELRIGDVRDLYDRCISGNDHDCQTLLRLNSEIIPGVLQPTTRMSFLRAALKTGGSESYARLVGSAGMPLDQRIEVASRTSLDTVVAVWHQRVLAARPEPTPVRKGQAAAVLGWSVFFLALALRSSRWR